MKEKTAWLVPGIVDPTQAEMDRLWYEEIMVWAKYDEPYVPVNRTWKPHPKLSYIEGMTKFDLQKDKYLKRRNV
jgi:hypothetical protein